MEVAAAPLTSKPRFSGEKTAAELKADLMSEIASSPIPDVEAPGEPPAPTPSDAVVVPFIPPSQKELPSTPPPAELPPTPPPAAATPLPPAVDTRYEDELRRLREEHLEQMAEERRRLAEERRRVQEQAAEVATREKELERLRREKELEDMLALKQVPVIPGYSEEDTRAIYDQLVQPAVKALASKFEADTKKVQERLETGKYVTEESVASLLEARAKEERRASAHDRVIRQHPDFASLKKSNPQAWDDLVTQPIRTADGLPTSRTYSDEIMSALERGSDQDVEFISGVVKVFKSRLGVGQHEAAAAALVEPAPITAQTATIPAVAQSKEEEFTWDDVYAMDKEYREGRISKAQSDDFLRRFNAAKAAGRVKP